MNPAPPTPDSGASGSAPSHSWGAEFGAQFALGWPLIIAQLAQISLLTTDVIMLGWLGPKFLAAAALANALFVAVQLFGIGIGESVPALIAQALGARDLRLVRRTVRQGIWLMLIVALIMLPVVWNIAPVYRLLGQNPELIEMGEHFLHFAVWLIFPAFLIMVFRGFLSAHGDTRVILLITVGGVVLNAACDYALIFGNWGFPRLELAGAGVATTIVNAAMLAIMVAYVQLRRRYRRYHIFARFFHADWARFAEMVRIGLPIGLMRLAEVGLFTTASLLQGWIGADAVAAHAIALNIASISFMVPLGISQAAAVRVGRAYGEGDREGVRRAGWTALGATVAFMALTGIAFLLFSRPLAGLFLDPLNPANVQALELAASYLIVAGLFQIFDGTQVTMSAALRGLSDTRVPLVVAILGYWAVGFPVSYVLGFPLGMGGVGIWFGLAAGLAAVGIVLTIRFAMRDRLGLTAGVPA